MNSTEWKKNRRWIVIVAALALAAVGTLVWWGRMESLTTVGPPDPAGVELPPLDLGTLSLEPVPRPSVLLEARPTGISDSSRATPTPKKPESDADRLAEVTSNWVYRGYVGVGQDQTGRFTHHARNEEEFFMKVRDVREGVMVTRLTRQAAHASLGDATKILPLVPESRIRPEDMANPAMPNPEQIRQAKTAYWENYGKRFQQLAKKYTPRPGERMPPTAPPSQEQVATAKANYFATWGPYYERLRAQRTPAVGENVRPQRTPVSEQEAIDDYYRRYRPGETPPTPPPWATPNN